MPSYAQRRAASLIRPSVDLRYLLSSAPRQQGFRPLCVPFSFSAVHEATRALSPARGAELLAVEPIWRHCLDNGVADDEGTTLFDGGEALVQKGQTTEACWPYNDALGAGTEPEPASATNGPWHFATTLPLLLRHDGIEDVIEGALAGGLPVVLVIELTDEFERPSPQGEIGVPPIRAPIGGYHAISVFGAATDPTGTSRRLLVRNSWGRGWAAGGYGWLPLDYLIAFAIDAALVDPTSLADTSTGVAP
jgi:hypothetical protein